jgi:hypothetical protein
MLAACLLAGLALLAQSAPAAGDTEVLVETYPDGKPRSERTVVRGVDGQPVDHGPYESFHPGGKRESKGRHELGKRVGAWEFRWEDGRMRARGSFEDGLEHGSWTTFHRDGEKESTGSYARGRRAGKWTFWKPDGEIDGAHTGVYGHVEELHPNGVVRASGDTFERQKHGRWIYRWPNGARQLAVSYAHDRLQDERYFFHRDDRLDPDWITRGEVRRLPEWVEDLAADELRAPEPWPTSGAAAGPRALVPEVLNALAACDLSTPEGLERAAEAHARLRDLFGGLGWTWDPAAAALLAQRWPSAWSLLAADDSAWELDFDPGFAWLELELADSALGQPPLPPDVVTGLDGQPVPPSIGAGAYGVRLDGGERPRPAELERAASSGEEWLRGCQAPDGAWRHGAEGGDELDTSNTALALLVLVGEGHSLVAGDLQRAVRSGVRSFAARQDPATGALGSPRAHALATWALVEVERASRPRGPRKAAERALAHLLRGQADDGSFGTDPATGAFALFALAVAHAGGYPLEADAVARARTSWSERAHAIAAGAGAAPFDATIVGSAYLAELVLGGRRAPALAPLATWLGAHPAAAGDPLLDFVFGAWAAYQHGKPHWQPWYEALRGPLLGGRGRPGSFPHPATAAEPGGALEVTALQLLALQTFYR